MSRSSSKKEKPVLLSSYVIRYLTWIVCITMCVVPFCWILLFCFTSSTSPYTKESTTSKFSMWDLDTSDTVSYVLFVLASPAVFMYTLMMFIIIFSIVCCKLYLYKPTSPTELGDAVPGVSIIKPLMGVDPLLEHNLETHFKLTYPKYELLFCFHDDQDSAIAVVDRLHEQYPHVDVKKFIGGMKDIVNPMVQNMAPAYVAAQYEYVWISSSRIEVSNEIIFDMAGKLQKSNVSLVHQIPFTLDSPGFGSAVEKIFFGTILTRFYITFYMFGICCVTGMSYMFKKVLLDQANGLPWFGRYLAEDYFLTKALHERGQLVISAIPARQNVGQTTVCAFVDRMVRWVKLRLNMMTGVAAVLEPLSDCFPLGLYAAWAFYHFFSLNPVKFLICHVLYWMLTDYFRLRIVQNGPLLFSFTEYVIAWIVRECTAAQIFFLSVINPHYIKWGRRTFRVKMGGITEEITEDLKAESL